MHVPTIRAPALRAGDAVAVVSPAGPVTPELLERGLRTLGDWGLVPRLDPRVYARRSWAGYLAGDDPARLDAVQQAIDDPDVRAVVFSRGGYGTMRLLDRLDLSGLRDAPKLLVGFSDITALHLRVAGVEGVATLHGPVVKSFGLHDDDPHTSLAALRDALFGRRPAPFVVDGLRTVRGGQAEGRLLGGNLSLVASLIASSHCPDLNGAVLFLEDVGEEDYRVDRLMTTLRLADKARRPAAIVLGDFTGCAGAYVDEAGVDAFVARLAAEFGCPVVADFPAGHGTRNVPLPMGVNAEVDADRGVISFAHDAVRA